MIKTMLIGHLGRDAEVKDFNGKSVINFTVAHSEKYTDRQTGEKREKTLWVDCAYWVEKTGIVQYLKKGTQVFVEGEPSARGWKDRDGEANATLQLRVFGVQLLGSASGNQGGNAPAQKATASSMGSPDDEDDLPF